MLSTMFSFLTAPMPHPPQPPNYPNTGCEPVWPSGKTGMQKDFGSNPLRLSLLFKSCGLWTLSCDCPSQLMKH